MILAALLHCAAFGQSEPQASFEIADVHVSPKTLHPMKIGGFRDGRFELEMATMTDLIATAWGIEPDKVLGGPDWLDMDRFDVIAGAPSGTSQQALRPMLQSLLEKRFGLTVHMDQKPFAAYVLSVGSGKPKLKESDSTTPGCQRQPQPPEAGPIPAVCRGLTMAAFAAQLGGGAGDFLNAPVVDNTKLEGAWDFTLKWTPRGRLAAAGAEGITIFDAIDKQLGLKLEAKQVPAPVLVVDHVNRKPTDNPPDVAASLPSAPPPHFEVATLKPTDPQLQAPVFQTPPNGQIAIRGVTLSYLIQTIWFVTPEMIVDAPKWLDTDRWDIVAKVSSVQGSAPRTDMDSMIVMVRALLEDRFRLKTHMEERVVRAYTLTASKPKLQRADPANRTGCKEGPGADGKDPRLTNPARSRLVTCRNMTMAQFADQLPNIANALNQLNTNIRSTVADSTGLSGAWDFTLSFTNGMGVQPAASAPPVGAEPADPNGALSLDEAISSQLGLKLELTKRPAPILVIDHVEQKPTEN
jgi:uncharacterized protein (TIGR03435 family)